MLLKLERPLAFIDLETTGKDVSKDRIVQIAVLKVFPNGREEMRSKIINPTIPISPEASKVHGIYDEDVVDEPKFEQIAGALVTYIADSDLAGFNSNRFDIPLLLAEFLRVGIDFQLEGRHFIDVMTIFHKMEERTLKAAYQFYCQEQLENAHNAEADIRATYEVLKAQIQRYESIEVSDKDGNKAYPVKNNVQVLSDFTPFNLLDPTGKVDYDDQERVVFTFGKYKSTPVQQVFRDNPGYYNWIMGQDFSDFTKRICEREFNALPQTSSYTA